MFLAVSRLGGGSRRTFPPIVAVALALLLLSLDAQADVTSSIESQDGQDTVIAFFFDNAVAANTMTIILREWKDLNSDGDFVDAGESVDIINLGNDAGTTCTNAALNPHLSCSRTVGARSRQVYVWRNATGNHRPGNYSFDVDFRDNLGGVILQYSAGIRIIPDNVQDAAVTAARENLRNQANAVEANETARLNTHGANVSVFASDHQGNESRALHEHAQNQTEETFFTWVLGQAPLFAIRGITPEPPTAFTLSLIQEQDSDSNGVMERSTLVSAPDVTSCAAAALMSHFACHIDLGAQRADILWRTNSSLYELGNYSLEYTWRASGISVQNYTIGFRLDAAGGNSTTTVQTTNVITNPPNLFNDNVGPFAILFLLGAVAAWVGQQRRMEIAILGLLGGIGLAGVLLSFPDEFESRTAWLTLIFISISVVFLTGYNILRLEHTRRETVARGDDVFGPSD